MNKTTTAIVAGFLALAVLPAGADGEFSLTYWAPSVSGDATISSGGQVFDIDFDDLLDDTGDGLQLRFQNKGDRFGAGIDLSYGSLEQSSGLTRTELDTLTVDLFGIVGLAEQVDLLIGIRSTGLDASVSLPGFGSADEHGGTVDGFVGARFDIPLGSSFSVDLQVDAGAGESDFLYHGLVGANWYFSANTSLRVAYKLLGYEFSDEDEPVDNEFDFTLGGPSVGLKVDF